MVIPMSNSHAELSSSEEQNKEQNIDIVPVKRALISVSDKTGLTDFAKALQKMGIEILSTGGTAKTLKDAGIDVKDISDHTGFPEIMDGRVKTLHPKVHGGILARRGVAHHDQAMKDNDIAPIDLLVVNLYPFAEVIASDDADFSTCIENIDIGGPAMVRAAAKNHEHVTIVTNTDDYKKIIETLQKHDGATDYLTRQWLASRAYALTAAYDAHVSAWFQKQLLSDQNTASEKDSLFPEKISFTGTHKQTLRYGENPHQKAALYTDNTGRIGVATATQVQGKELSYNNLNDTDAAFELVSEFTDPCVAIIKHANPCGVSIGENLHDAYNRAFQCDTVSAFGGIIAVNRMLDKQTAEAIIKRFCEVIIAPSIDAEAASILETKPNIRVLTTGKMANTAEDRLLIKNLSGGLLIQTADTGIITPESLNVVTDREPTDREMEDMIFAFKVAKHVKSNAIVYTKDLSTVGIGAGQMSRLDSSRIAARKSMDAAKDLGQEEPLTKGSVVASDAFFPFADGLLAAADAGATAVIQPGGSIRDEDIITAANDRGLAMVFTGMRHFKH